jgi:DNA-binding IclR family transcriptional regulator
MSSPSPAEPILVRPAFLESLAAELSALAGELATDADLCRSTGHSLLAALGDVEGWTAQAATTTWAALQELLADGTAALARSFLATAADYAEHDGSLGRRIAAGRTAGPR